MKVATQIAGVKFICTNIGMSDFMRIAGYHNLSTPEASDNFSDTGSFPVHEQVSSENPDG